MILRINSSAVWALFTTLLLLPAQFALSSETTSEDEDAKTDETAVIFKTTIPVARNPLPAEIIDRMRKKLATLMGVDESAEPAKKTGH